MEIDNKLTRKWVNKIQKGEEINITDLYEFSKINLKRSRIRKKFNKYYDRYVPKNIKEAYWGIVISRPIYNFTKSCLFSEDFVSVEPLFGEPKVELIYSDYRYDENK